MSVASTTARFAVTITSLPQTVPVFAFNAAADLILYDGGTTNSTNNPAHVLVLGSDYTVTGGGYNALNQLQTGNVVIVGTGSNAVQIGDVITVLRNIALTQSTTFASTGLQTPLMIEADDDRLTTVAQELNDPITRSMRAPPQESLDWTMPNASTRATTLPYFDSNGNLTIVTLPNLAALLASGGGSPAGNVFVTGTPVAGQTAEWTNATTIQGISTTGTGNYVKATGATLGSPNLTTPVLAGATATGATAIDLSGSTAIFKTPTGAGTFGGSTNRFTNGILGEAGNAAAAAGNIGEYNFANQNTPQNLTTNIALDVISLSLSAGDWDVGGNVYFAYGTTTTSSSLAAWISTLSASFPGGTQTVSYYTLPVAANAGNAISLLTPFCQVKLASAGTVYLSCSATFLTSTLTAKGTLWYRRSANAQ